MVETFIAFLIWASTGAVFAMVGAHPILTALCRYFFAGLFLQATSTGLKLSGQKISITHPVPWKDPRIWAGGFLLVIGNIFFNISVTKGPVAISGLTYGYIPLVIPLISLFLGLDRRKPLSKKNWVGLVLAFCGNYLLFRGLYQSDFAIGTSVMAALLAATCFGMGPLITSALQRRGVGDWVLLRGQNAAAMVLSVPLAFLLWNLDLLPESNLPIIQKSIALGVFASIGFTILPFYLWFRGIRRDGPGRTTVFVFLNPLMACLLSVFGLKDLPLTYQTLSGMGFILLGLVMSLGLGTSARVVLPRPFVPVFSAFLVVHPLLFPIVCGAVFGWDGNQLLQLMLHPFHLLVIGLSFLAGAMVFSLHRYAIPVLGLFVAALAGESLAFIEQVQDPVEWIFMPIALMAVMALIVMGFRNLRRSPRVHVQLNAKLETSSGVQCKVKVFNLSQSGCGVRFADDQTFEAIRDEVSVRLIFRENGRDEELVLKVIDANDGVMRGHFLELTHEKQNLLNKWMQRKAVKNRFSS